MTDYSADQSSITVVDNSRIFAGVVIGAGGQFPGESLAVLIRNNATLDVYGTIWGRPAITGSGGSVVVVHATGSVAGRVNSHASLTNYGSISFHDSGSTAAAEAVTIVNLGVIGGGTGARAGATLTNAGTIMGLSSVGASATGTLTNSGTITGALLGAGGGTLINSGTISGARGALADVIRNTGAIVGTTSGAESDLVDNAGTITGGSFAVGTLGEVINSNTISGVDNGVLASASGQELLVTIRNSGLITATAAAGRAIAVDGGLTSIRVENDGRIVATGANAFAILGGDGVDTVLNRGAITGAVSLGASDDLYDGTLGTIASSVSMGTGDDTAMGGLAGETLNGDAGDDILKGEAGDDGLNGGADSDLLDGGSGNDRMTGGTGNDTFYVDSTLDRVLEDVNGGTDTVLTLANFVLRSGQEIEALSAAPDADFALTLRGNEFAQAITGTSGEDRITSGGGADTLIGLGGSDMYILTDGDASVVEAVGGGYDIVLVSTGYTLNANVEELRAGGTDPINLTGNGDDNRLVGNSGGNVLDGAGGADTMIGGAGNDIYFVEDADDTVSDISGHDTVYASIDYKLANRLEELRLIGTALAGTGNVGDNFIAGNSGDNVLNGRGGLDSIIGAGGADRFVCDVAVKVGNVISVGDFEAGIDKFALDDFVFRNIGAPGALDARFFSNGPATTRDQHILFDTTTGDLSYDRDGSGSAAAIVFAHVDPSVPLTAADIIVV